MAENKKSFVLYADMIHTVKKMPKSKQADLFMTILKYVNDENPVVEDLIVSLVWEPIKFQLKRDLLKYENIRTKKSDAGKKGMEIRYKKDNSVITEPNSVTSLVTKLTDTVNDNVTVNVNDINNTSVSFKTMPLPEDGGEIPEIIAGSCIELVKFTKNKRVTVETIKGMWPLFKIQNLTGKKYYADVGSIYSHFMNWIKTQNFEEIKDIQPGKSNLSATVRKLNEQHAAKKKESATG